MKEAVKVQKLMAMRGIGSRRYSESLVVQGLVKVNGVRATIGLRVPMDSKIEVDGLKQRQESVPFVYWVFNKPDMTLVSRVSEGEKISIFELPSLSKQPFEVNPAGRLDYRTEGLLILSNDGEFLHRLMHPKYKVPRDYEVLVNSRLDDVSEKAIRHGIELKDGKVSSCRIRYQGSLKMGASKGFCYRISVREGRNRLVRRIFEHFDIKVIRLIRVAYGELSLPENLPVGGYRQMTSTEIKRLKKQIQM